MSVDPTEAIEGLRKELGVSEAREVTTFVGLREHPDVSVQEVTVEVLDGGGGERDSRYAVNIRFRDGTEDIVGDPAPTLDEALSDVRERLG